MEIYPNEVRIHKKVKKICLLPVALRFARPIRDQIYDPGIIWRKDGDYLFINDRDSPNELSREYKAIKPVFTSDTYDIQKGDLVYHVGRNITFHVMGFGESNGSKTIIPVGETYGEGDEKIEMRDNIEVLVADCEKVMVNSWNISDRDRNGIIEEYLESDETYHVKCKPVYDRPAPHFKEVLSHYEIESDSFDKIKIIRKNQSPKEAALEYRDNFIFKQQTTTGSNDRSKGFEDGIRYAQEYMI